MKLSSFFYGILGLLVFEVCGCYFSGYAAHASYEEDQAKLGHLLETQQVPESVFEEITPEEANLPENIDRRPAIVGAAVLDQSGEVVDTVTVSPAESERPAGMSR